MEHVHHEISKIQKNPSAGFQSFHPSWQIVQLGSQVATDVIGDCPYLPAIRSMGDYEKVTVGHKSTYIQNHQVFGLLGLCRKSRLFDES